MKSKALLVSFVAFFALAFALATVSASDYTDEFVDVIGISVNDIDLPVDPIVQAVGVSVSEDIPVVVKFTALEDVEDVRVKVYIEGYKSEVSEQTSRFHILDGNTYVKRFTLELPSSLDLDDLSEEVSLLIRISAKGRDSQEYYITLEIQRELYSLNLLSIDVSEVTVVGDQVNVDVVVENNGHNRLDNVYVKASIPELGVTRKVFVGDLAAEQDRFDDDIDDSASKKIYLTIPRSASPGNYEMEIEAYNYDISATTKARVVVRGLETGVLPAVTTKTIAPGEETFFDLVLVNPNNKMVLYTITPEDVKGLLVEVSEPIAAVAPESSKTLKIKVKATESVQEGTYVVKVNAVGEPGLSKQVSFTVNVEKTTGLKDGITVGDKVKGPTNTVIILTVVLVIIFVVLLVILIVLLTKRPAETEEFGETNYY